MEMVKIPVIIRIKKKSHRVFQNQNFFQDSFFAHSDRFLELELSCL